MKYSNHSTATTRYKLLIKASPVFKVVFIKSFFTKKKKNILPTLAVSHLNVSYCFLCINNIINCVPVFRGVLALYAEKTSVYVILCKVM